MKNIKKKIKSKNNIYIKKKVKMLYTFIKIFKKKINY